MAARGIFRRLECGSHRRKPARGFTRPVLSPPTAPRRRRIYARLTKRARPWATIPIASRNHTRGLF